MNNSGANASIFTKVASVSKKVVLVLGVMASVAYSASPNFRVNKTVEVNPKNGNKYPAVNIVALKDNLVISDVRFNGSNCQTSHDVFKNLNEPQVVGKIFPNVGRNYVVMDDKYDKYFEENKDAVYKLFLGIKKKDILDNLSARESSLENNHKYLIESTEKKIKELNEESKRFSDNEPAWIQNELKKIEGAMHQQEEEFRIKKENLQAAIQDIKHAFEEQGDLDKDLCKTISTKYGLNNGNGECPFYYVFMMGKDEFDKRLKDFEEGEFKRWLSDGKKNKEEMVDLKKHGVEFKLEKKSDNRLIVLIENRILGLNPYMSNSYKIEIDKSIYDAVPPITIDTFSVTKAPKTKFEKVFKKKLNRGQVYNVIAQSNCAVLDVEITSNQGKEKFSF